MSGWLNLPLQAAGAIAADSDLNGHKLFDSTGPAQLGTAGASANSLATGDVIVGGLLEVLGANLFIPAAGKFAFTGRTRLASPADGMLQIQTSAGATTDVVTSLLFGPNSSAGVRMFKNGTGTMQFGLADLSGNATLAAAVFQAVNDTGSPQYNSSGAPTYGFYVNTAGPYAALMSAGATALKASATTLTAMLPMVMGSAAADPTGVNGMIYYNTGNNTLKVFVNSAWKTFTVA